MNEFVNVMDNKKKIILIKVLLKKNSSPKKKLKKKWLKKPPILSQPSCNPTKPPITTTPEPGPDVLRLILPLTATTTTPTPPPPSNLILMFYVWFHHLLFLPPSPSKLIVMFYNWFYHLLPLPPRLPPPWKRKIFLKCVRMKRAQLYTISFHSNFFLQKHTGVLIGTGYIINLKTFMLQEIIKGLEDLNKLVKKYWF